MEVCSCKEGEAKTMSGPRMDVARLGLALSRELVTGTRWVATGAYELTHGITLQNVPYMDLLTLMSFEVTPMTTMTTMDSQEPACCYNSHLLGFLQLPYKACFGGAKFDTGLDPMEFDTPSRHFTALISSW